MLVLLTSCLVWKQFSKAPLQSPLDSGSHVPRACVLRGRSVRCGRDFFPCTHALWRMFYSDNARLKAWLSQRIVPRSFIQQTHNGNGTLQLFSLDLIKSPCWQGQPSVFPDFPWQLPPWAAANAAACLAEFTLPSFCLRNPNFFFSEQHCIIKKKNLISQAL